eukprot:2887747-Rhodomonas_salina.3
MKVRSCLGREGNAGREQSCSLEGGREGRRERREGEGADRRRAAGRLRQGEAVRALSAMRLTYALQVTHTAACAFHTRMVCAAASNAVNHASLVSRARLTRVTCSPRAPHLRSGGGCGAVARSPQGKAQTQKEGGACLMLQ